MIDNLALSFIMLIIRKKLPSEARNCQMSGIRETRHGPVVHQPAGGAPPASIALNSLILIQGMCPKRFCHAVSRFPTPPQVVSQILLYKPALRWQIEASSSLSQHLSVHFGSKIAICAH